MRRSQAPAGGLFSRQGRRWRTFNVQLGYPTDIGEADALPDGRCLLRTVTEVRRQLPAMMCGKIDAGFSVGVI
jgi:hypothetical protein